MGRGGLLEPNLEHVHTLPNFFGVSTHMHCICAFHSGKVAKEVVEASSKIQRDPPEVHR